MLTPFFCHELLSLHSGDLESGFFVSDRVLPEEVIATPARCASADTRLRAVVAFLQSYPLAVLAEAGNSVAAADARTASVLCGAVVDALWEQEGALRDWAAYVALLGGVDEERDATALTLEHREILAVVLNASLSRKAVDEAHGIVVDEGDEDAADARSLDAAAHVFAPALDALLEAHQADARMTQLLSAVIPRVPLAQACESQPAARRAYCILRSTVVSRHRRTDAFFWPYSLLFCYPGCVA